MAEEFKVNGLKELDKMLQKLPEKVAKKAVRSALNKAKNPVIKGARSRIPNITFTRGSTTFNSSAIRIVNKIKIFSNGGYVIIGPSTNPESNWLHWIEFGTLAERKIPVKKSRSAAAEELVSRGMGLGKPFKRPVLRPALNNNRTKSIGLMRKDLKVKIPKLAKF